MKYQVMRYEEDLDFGCEERGADEPVMAVVVLKTVRRILVTLVMS